LILKRTGLGEVNRRQLARKEGSQISCLGNFSRIVTISCLFTSSCAQNLRFSGGLIVLVHRDSLTAAICPDLVHVPESAPFGKGNRIGSQRSLELRVVGKEMVSSTGLETLFSKRVRSAK
jgi:hypothetical protein